MKFYGYKNTKINRLIGALKGGEWVSVSLIKYLFLKIGGYITKVEPGGGVTK